MKVKRTYNLSEELVLEVRDAVDKKHVAPTQDAAVEEALRDYLLALRYREDAQRFAELAKDPEIQAELAQIEADLAPFEPEWPEWDG